jgi:hypothetical protein
MSEAAPSARSPLAGYLSTLSIGMPTPFGKPPQILRSEIFSKRNRRRHRIPLLQQMLDADRQVAKALACSMEDRVGDRRRDARTALPMHCLPTRGDRIFTPFSVDEERHF